MDSGNDPIKLLKRSSKSLLVDKEGANERKNTTTTSEEEEAVATRKMEKKEETRNAKKRGRKRLGRERKEANLEVKTVESEETMVDPSLEEKFLVSILEESGVLRANSKELLSIQMNVLRKSHPSKDRISEKEQEDDENLTKADSKEKITDSHHEEKEKDEASKEASKEDETVVKIEATCTDVTRSKDLENNDPKEKEEKVASSPDVNTALKNSNATESTIFLSRSPTTSHGKQEDDLNAIIRRMIMMELKRHRKKETVLKRAHSDTESTLARKKRSEDSRTGLFGGKGQTFFRDLLELEESLRKRSDNESDYQLTDKVEIDRPIAKLENSGEREQNRSRNDIDVTTIDPARYSLNSIGTAYKSDSNIELERKVNASCLKDAEGKRSIRHRKVTVINQQNQANKSTQTEYVYVIRAVRSCPLRKKRVSMQFHINQLASNSDAIYSKTVFASLDLSTFIFRKASDNLIYEKGKGSRSPSYIPTPERHRWKYITPSKNK
ncbi:uncharacterized protein LOC122710557 [Apis laboriosa]|uniref:uncharacterized protein LOC122710557 n=1 Tax=Apis laboriosa TaxID=183418 RepID=UPI001CC79567|nr:uncharacterized protein LOC122710557 [Apis laboriosa]